MKSKALTTPKKIDAPKKKAESTRAALIKSVIADYEDRKLKRRNLELQWRLNLDFYSGKQNSMVTAFDTIANISKQFAWQRNESFNHIVSLMESRMSRITTHRIELQPQPETDGEGTGASVDLCKKLLNSAFEKNQFERLREQATMWSEVTGTAFYKVSWNEKRGKTIGIINDGKDEQQIREGDIVVSIHSPFEIYPDNMGASDVFELGSLIHAQNGVIERYEAASEKYPNGRLTIVEGEKLLYDGELPYINQKDGVRGIPFVRQTSESFVGSFFGRSVIERLIPVQRAYNAVKNRKVEFLNRLACGILVAEEGSVDFEALENDGLAPGKVIVYRQGSTAPKFLETGEIPAELEREEERLLAEFESIGGGGDVIRNFTERAPSGTALAILVEQDARRMKRVMQSVEWATCAVAAQILRLYKQFAANKRLEKMVSAKGVELFDFDGNAITCDSVTIVEGEQLNG